MKRQELLTFVLVGGGPTGVELAGAVAELANHALSHDFRRINPASARVVLVEGEPRIVPTFPASLTRKARTKLQQLGVEVRTGVQRKLRQATNCGNGSDTILRNLRSFGIAMRPNSRRRKASRLSQSCVICRSKDLLLWCSPPVIGNTIMRSCCETCWNTKGKTSEYQE